MSLRNHVPKMLRFLTGGCVRTLRHLYDYATAYMYVSTVANTFAAICI